MKQPWIRIGTLTPKAFDFSSIDTFSMPPVYFEFFTRHIGDLKFRIATTSSKYVTPIMKFSIEHGAKILVNNSGRIRLRVSLGEMPKFLKAIVDEKLVKLDYPYELTINRMVYKMVGYMAQFPHYYPPEIVKEIVKDFLKYGTIDIEDVMAFYVSNTI